MHSQGKSTWRDLKIREVNNLRLESSLWLSFVNSLIDNFTWDPCLISFNPVIGGNESESPSVMTNTLPPHGLYSPSNSPGQDTGLGSYSLVQGISPIQESNPGLPHCGRILYQLSHQGSPILLCCCCCCCCCCWVTSVVSDPVQPHRRQPTRVPCAWGSPGKNTGVGCHFLLQCMKVKRECEVTQSCPTLCDPMDCSLPGPSVHGIFQARVLEWVAIAFSTNPVIDINKYKLNQCEINSSKILF